MKSRETEAMLRLFLLFRMCSKFHPLFYQRSGETLAATLRTVITLFFHSLCEGDLGMQRYSIRLVAALATFLVGIAATIVPTAFYVKTIANNQIEQEVLEVERQYINAHVERDTATLERILADDFTIRFPYGRFSTKAERLALFDNTDFSFVSFTTDDVQTQIINEYEAVGTGRAMLTGRYQDRRFRSRTYGYTRTYEKRQGQWQIVSVRIARLSSF